MLKLLALLEFGGQLFLEFIDFALQHFSVSVES
jgi:hypothetical protein